MVLTRRTTLTELQAARARSGMTLEAIAEKVGRDVSTISRWLRGKQQPDWDQLDQLAKAMRQPITLHFGPGQKESPPPSWAGAMESRIVSEVRANRAGLYRRLADDAAVRALRRAGLLPDEPPDETQGPPPAAAGPSQGPGR